MAKQTLILLGTKKGAFVVASDTERRSWELRGPFCETWPMNHVIADPVSGTIYGGGGNEWFGPAVWKSTDLGATWTHSSEGLAYQAGEEPIKSVWSVAQGASGLYAGVQPAGLFRSDDDGQSWQHVAGLRESSVAAALEPGRRRADPALAGSASHRRETALGRHLRRRRVLHRGWRRDLGAAQPRHPRRFPTRRVRDTRNSASACIAW